MFKDKMILLRIQSPDGTKRVEVSPNDPTVRLFENARQVFDLPSFMFALYKERGRKQEISSSKTKTLAQAGLSHGHLIYLAPINGSVISGEPGPSTSNGKPISTQSTSNGPEEDEVDKILARQSGKIERNRDDKLCRHVANGRCVHCSPLEPYDESYLKEHNIKHLSFQSYLRKLMAGVDRGKFVSLEPVSCTIKPGCTEHPPWPKGVCSKCTPHAITLNRQTYRHIDNVVVENPRLVERFLDYWRTCGHQRLGFLYGKHEVHADVPLGIRATVSVIYEPPQESGPDYIRLLPDERQEIVEEMARCLGLKRVGWIFTDLLADDAQAGAVKHIRNIDSHFLSAQECIIAGHLQNQHLNPCRYSPTGHFGSKFVTVCVTGDSTKQVHMEGYQVSEQCMSLVRDNCLVPTKDAPELGYVPESTDKKYIPDVFYKIKDSYGNEVSRLARPLPIEYLLVDVPASTPLTPQYTFECDIDIRPFPVENRLLDGHVQHLQAIASYLAQFSPNGFLTAVSDFHFLLFIATMELYPMREFMAPLLAAVRAKDAAAALEWSQSEHWGTLEQLIAASGEAPARMPSHEETWHCERCTFVNTRAGSSCEMCNLPRYCKECEGVRSMGDCSGKRSNSITVISAATSMPMRNAYAGEVRNAGIDCDRLDEAEYRRGLSALHTLAVDNTNGKFAPNRVLGHKPPEIAEEKGLARKTRTTLSQQRSGWSTHLNNYMSRINPATSDTCPSCGGTPHDTLHLFSCPNNPNGSDTTRSVDKAGGRSGVPGTRDGEGVNVATTTT